MTPLLSYIVVLAGFALLIAGFIAARRKAYFKLTFLKIFEVTLESGERDASSGP